MHIPNRYHFSLIGLVNFFFICFGLSLSYNAVSQEDVLYEDSFIETTSDQVRFSMYLDTIIKYRYVDIDIASQVTDVCDKMLNDGVVLQDSVLLDFAIASIYLKYNKLDAVGAYELIIENEYLLNSQNVMAEQVGNFLYLRSYTLLVLGDFEAAQIAFYEGIEKGKAVKDTASVIQSLYSLGQLYTVTEEYEEAIECFDRIIEYGKTSEIAPSTHALTYVELGKTYISIEDYEKALKSLDYAYIIMDSLNIEVLKSDALVEIGNVYLAQKDVNAANEIYLQMREAKNGPLDQNNVVVSRKFLAKLNRLKMLYPQALEIYKEIINEMDSTNLDYMIETYAEVSELCFEMKNYKLAYEYLTAHNEAKEKKDDDTKRQKTAYLKIKYNSAQKEKENLQLTATVSQNNAERKTIFSWLGLSTLLLLFLIGALYQKRRYSIRLEEDVLKRTLSLEKSNNLLNISIEELDEFNRILSHDLKEPLRGIVGFSQLACRDIHDEDKVKQYLKYVSKNGQQLGQLIDDVSAYRNVDSMKVEEKTNVNIAALFDEISNVVMQEFPDKEIKLELTANNDIYCSAKLVKAVLKRIVDNAARFNDNKHVKVRVNYEMKNRDHVLYIEDNGIGIIENYHTQIFKMFKRLNNRESYSGSGLGLSIAQKLIRKLDGEISIVRSEKNVGTTFKVTFEA